MTRELLCIPESDLADSAQNSGLYAMLFASSGLGTIYAPVLGYYAGNILTFSTLHIVESIF